LTSASTRSSTSSNSARLFGTALVFDVAGSSSLALVLGVACSPGRTLLLNIGCTPSCLLLRTVATLALAVAVLAPLSLAFAVAALASERARRRDALRVSLACASELRLRVPTYREISMAHMCDFPWNDLTPEFDTLTGGHAVTLPPGSVIEVHGTPIGGSSTWGPQYPDGKAA